VSSGYPLVSVVLLAFWTVLLAELVGDKALYVLPSLTARFRGTEVLAAFSLANAGKMMIAVLLGSSIMRLQSRWTNLFSAVAFFISAILIWVEDPEEPTRRFGRVSWPQSTLACCGFFFLMEWGDPGQIAAAALVLKSHQLIGVWLGATAAIVTKGAVVVCLGSKLSERLPRSAFRWMASGCCCILGLVAVAQVLMR
jgi:putative Ca2+/H+ antiporter (TMEM165/GDT1 family)